MFVLQPAHRHGRTALVDYARAAIDELEHPQFGGRRFTIAAV